jgi:LacI family transcriptional regulator
MKKKTRYTMAVSRHVAVLPEMYQNYDRGVLRGISAYVHEHGHWSLYVEEEIRHRVPDFRNWPGDGAIVNFDDWNVVHALRGFKQPVVGYGGGRGWHDPASGIPYFETDDDGIAQLAADHLVERGFRYFAFCGYPPTRLNVWVARRAEGFKRRLALYGYSCFQFNGHFTTHRRWKELQAELADWLASLPKPVGLMACYDARARHVLEACRTLQLRVPDDVAVIGVDNDELMCELAVPPLSSVEQGRFQLGYEAAALLDRMMDGRKPEQPRFCIKPARLVCRQSTNLLMVSDEMVSNALQIIRNGACDGLTMEQLVGELAVSRSTLDNRFKEVLGHTAYAAIQRTRLERAKSLLSQGDMPVKLVAQRAGFGNEQYLTAVMKKETKNTPAQYRRATKHLHFDTDSRY